MKIIIYLLLTIIPITLNSEIVEFKKLPPVNEKSIIGEWEAVELYGTVYILIIHELNNAKLAIATSGDSWIYQINNISIAKNGVISASSTHESRASIALAGTGVALEPGGDQGHLSLVLTSTISSHKHERKIIFKKARFIEKLYNLMILAKNSLDLNKKRENKCPEKPNDLAKTDDPTKTNDPRVIGLPYDGSF